MFLDIFSQISDGNGLLLQWRFNEYLQEVLALPAAVYESPTFNYTDSLANSIFSPVRINHKNYTKQLNYKTLSYPFHTYFASSPSSVWRVIIIFFSPFFKIYIYIS